MARADTPRDSVNSVMELPCTADRATGDQRVVHRGNDQGITHKNQSEESTGRGMPLDAAEAGKRQTATLPRSEEDTFTRIRQPAAGGGARLGD